VNRAQVAAAILFAPAAVLAHHSGIYDEQKLVEIEGTITAVQWINPHVHISVAAVAPDASSWDVEATSINALERWGVQREWFVVGSRVSVKGPASRFEPHAMAGAIVDFADGRQVVLWPTIAGRLGLAAAGGLLPPRPANASPESQPSRGIFKVWTPRERLTGLTTLPLTDRARAAKSNYVAVRDDPALRCEPAGMPVMLDTPYPIEFVDRGDRIAMNLEEWDGERTIYMKPDGGLPRQERSPNGISLGRWDGKTLVIETTKIDYQYSDDLGTPQSKDVTVLERYTPSEDGTRLDTVVTVTDPATYTEPAKRSNRTGASWSHRRRQARRGRPCRTGACEMIGALGCRRAANARVRLVVLEEREDRRADLGIGIADELTDAGLGFDGGTHRVGVDAGAPFGEAVARMRDGCQIRGRQRRRLRERCGARRDNRGRDRRRLLESRANRVVGRWRGPREGCGRRRERL
jgi:Family of unknown function (DUF6152)